MTGRCSALFERNSSAWSRAGTMRPGADGVDGLDQKLDQAIGQGAAAEVGVDRKPGQAVRVGQAETRCLQSSASSGRASSNRPPVKATARIPASRSNSRLTLLTL